MAGSVYGKLSDYISKTMRMSHIYQPVMIRELLIRGGKASVDEIATALLAHDPSQIVLIFWELKRDRAVQSRPWLARQQRKVNGGLAEVARLVGEGDWAVGDRFGLGDIATGTLLRFLDVRYPDLGWRGLHPALVGYSDRLEARPSFRQTVPRAQQFSDAVV